MRLVDQYKSNSLGSTEQVSFRARARNLLNRNQGQIPNHETVTGDVQITRPLNTIISNSSALFPIRAPSLCAPFIDLATARFELQPYSHQHPRMFFRIYPNRD